MKVHLFSGSGFAWRVELALAFKGIEYEQVLLQPTQEHLKSDAFMAISPRGKVPVLQDGDFTISESMAAIAYLDRKYPEQPLFGKTPEEGGLIWRCILDFDLYVANNFADNIIVPILFGQFESAPEGIQQAAKIAHKELAKLEKNLNNKTWFVGDAISAADIAIYPMVEALIRFCCKPEVSHLALDFDDFDGTYPNLGGWRKAVQGLPNYESTYPSFWRQVDEAQ